MALPTIALPRWKLAAVIGVLSLGVTMLASVAGFGSSLAPAALITGWFILIPLVALLGSDLPLVESPGDDGEPTVEDVPTVDSKSPVEQLRERYARGELSDEEFERRLDRLLETEGLSVADHANEAADAADGDAFELERE
ncbi:SHOCT domain-containing protein [Haloarcula salina]|uniref:SHOCT domain-containing protein n=1 Tax=Haloarcula salina TaxID=1429914 RepID=A0AA41FXF1_9EURY|nr:SHOCT domain-containing protein [Haloarcula salina]MBV0900360.1 SHOCT domain-containing protein [Haloarcula salina]